MKKIFLTLALGIATITFAQQSGMESLQNGSRTKKSRNAKKTTRTS
jgi:hypothetical protein